MIDIDITGATIPKLGFGTWEMVGRECRDAVLHALAVGYRHIDTAQMYENEAEVGAALRETSVARDEIFVTTKIWRENLTPRRVHATTRESLKRLGLDHIDLLLIHWHNDEVPLSDTLGAMVELCNDGCVRHIGVSNFTPRLMERAITMAPIVCNQVEYHPYLAQDACIEIARQTNTVLTAYSPLARGKVVSDRLLSHIGGRYGKSAAQVTLRWHIQQPSVVAIPKAATREHIVANANIFDFELTADEMDQIRSLASGDRIVDPVWAPRWGQEPRADVALWRKIRRVAPGIAPESPSRHTGKSQDAPLD